MSRIDPKPSKAVSVDETAQISGALGAARRKTVSVRVRRLGQHSARIGHSAILLSLVVNRTSEKRATPSPCGLSKSKWPLDPKRSSSSYTSADRDVPLRSS